MPNLPQLSPRRPILIDGSTRRSFSVFRSLTPPVGWLLKLSSSIGAGGTKDSPLPDFYIGAHSEIEGLTLVTRDAARYRTYFPGVTIICP